MCTLLPSFKFKMKNMVPHKKNSMAYFLFCKYVEQYRFLPQPKKSKLLMNLSTTGTVPPCTDKSIILYTSSWQEAGRPPSLLHISQNQTQAMAKIDKYLPCKSKIVLCISCSILTFPIYWQLLATFAFALFLRNA